MKILVLRFSSIGDIVLTSPVLRCLKEQVPAAEVHVATKAAFSDLVRFSPHVDKVHELEDDLGALIDRLREEHYDHVVDLHRNVRTARVKRALGVPASSFNKLNIRKWLLVNLRIDRLPRVHIVQRYLEAAEGLGVKDDGRGLELFIPEDRGVDPALLPAEHRNGFHAFAIGAAHATKRLPLRRSIELARAIPGPVVLIGGREDMEMAAAIGDAVGGKVFDATGRFDLLASASLIGRAKGVFAHDSGAMHMACALGRPVVCIWGSTVPAFGMGPYQPEHPDRARIAEVKGLDCRPCSKIGFAQCPKGHFHCMEHQDIPAIVAELPR